MPTYKTDFAYRLKKAAERAGVELNALFNRKGLTRTALSNYLNGVTEANATTLRVVAPAHTSADYLLGLTDDPTARPMLGSR